MKMSCTSKRLRRQCAPNGSAMVAMLLLMGAAVAGARTVWAADVMIPAMHGATLDGHSIEWPRDLSGPMVLVFGFSRGAADATTAWERALRALPAAQAVHFYDLPVVAAAPSFVRPWIIRSIRNQVPLAARPYILPLTENEAQWKQAASYTGASPNAAYVVVVDAKGAVHWTAHEDFSAAALQQLLQRVRELK
jgi:hypothetical protein